jgi:HAAS
MSDHYDPFEHYVAEVIRHLGKLSPEQQEQIAEELQTHLEDAAAAYGAQAESPAVRARIVGQIGTPRSVGRALAKVHDPINIWHSVRQITMRLRKVAGGLAATAALLFFCFSLMIVPVPNSKTAAQITGTVACISRPHPTNGDITIALEDGRKFYVNRADEVEYFAWERLLREVRAGDTIHLTAVQPLGERWIEPGRAGGYTPLAGIRTSSVIYMDERISAHTWHGAGLALQMGLAALLITCLFSVPEISGLLGRRTIA